MLFFEGSRSQLLRIRYMLGPGIDRLGEEFFENYVYGLGVIELAKNSTHEDPGVLAAVTGLGKIYAGRSIVGYARFIMCMG